MPAEIPISTAAGSAVLLAALLLVARDRSMVAARAAAACTGFFASMALARHVSEVSSSWTMGPGPMTNTEAFALVFLSLAVLALSLRGSSGLRVHVTRACAGTAAAICLLVLADGTLGSSSRLLPAAIIRPATAAMLLALALAIAAASASRAEASALHRIDAYAAWSAGLLAALVFIAWTTLEAREWRERDADARLARDNVAGDLLSRLQLRADALQRLAERGDIYGPLSREQFEAEAQGYLRDLPGLNAMIFADPGLVVRWRVARHRSEDLVGSSIGIDDGRLEAFETAAMTGRVRMSKPVALRSGGHGVILVVPVLDGGRLHGFITASIRLPEVYRLIDEPLLRNFSVTVKDGPDVLLQTADELPATGTYLAQDGLIEPLGRQWQVVVSPSARYLMRMHSALPAAVFWLGMLAVALVAAAFAQSRRAYLRGMAMHGLSTQLADTLESITDAFYTLDRDWRFTYINREAEKLLQRSRESLMGRVVWEEFPQAAGSLFHQKYQLAVETAATVDFEAYYEPLATWFGVRAYPSPDGLAIYFKDVSALVKGREALLESERELRALAESMPQIIWMSKPTGDVTYFNQRWVDFSGLSLSESYGSAWTACVHPDDLPVLRADWREARDQGTYLGTECRLRRVDGTYRWMLMRAAPFRARAGVTVKWMGTCTDIDDLRRSADAVRASEERFRLLTRATRDAVLDADLGTGDLWWNEAFEQQFGYTRQTLPQTLDGWSGAIHPEDRERVLASMAGLHVQPAGVWSAEFRFRRSDGAWANVLARGCVIREESPAGGRMLAWITDVTERLALEERLRQSQRLESLGQLTGGVAHDFNNLLTVIVGNAETLQEELSREPDLALLARMIVEAADRGSGLTQRLLAFARRQALAPVPLDIGEAVENLRPLLERTLGEHVRVEIDLETSAEAAKVLVDPTQLDNAILNLSLNARDAMPQGGVLAIRVAQVDLDAPGEPDLQGGGYVSIVVRDNGCGMKPEHLERVFEPFFTTKERGKGTGLGLAMVYGFIKQSGGSIRVESRLGSGTTFSILLPRVEGREAGADAQPTPDADMEGGRERVLLVEDEDAVRQFATRQLHMLGYSVVSVGDPHEAVAMLRAGETFDVLFTDVVMPGLTGPALVRAARSLQPGLKVLYTSGYMESSLQREEFETDAPPLLLPKPYRRAELARFIRLALAVEA